MTDRQLTIQDVLAAQKNLQVAMGNPMGEGQAGVKENILALIVEATEVLNEISWKPWKKDKPILVDMEALLTEMTDVLQFWANIVNSMGYTADEVTASLSAKWAENYRRLLK